MQPIPDIDTRLPAYIRIRDALAARIARSEFDATAPLPSEQMLAKDYAVSVGTIRKAVDGLVAERLLERRQGSGTFVRAPSFNATLFRFFRFRTSDDDPHTIPSSELLLRAKTKAPKKTWKALGTDAVIKTVRLRSFAERPVLFEKIYVPQNMFSGFENLDEAELGPLLYPVYFEHFGVLVHKATDDLSFGTADAQTAARLHLEVGDPLAIIERTAFAADGSAVEWRIAYGDATNFHYQSQIT